MGEGFDTQEVIVETKILKATINIAGMHCASCAINVEKKLQSLPGVVAARVNFASEKASVSFDPGVVDIERLHAAITDAGYKPITGAVDLQNKERKLQQRSLKRRFAISLCLSVPLMYISMAAALNLPLYAVIGRFSSLIQLLFATLVMACGHNFFSSGVMTLFRTRRANMDTLISLGAGSAYAYSVVLTWSGRTAGAAHYHAHLYYETAAFIITFILLGKYLESAAKTKTSAALYKLMDLAPKTSFVLRGG